MTTVKQAGHHDILIDVTATLIAPDRLRLRFLGDDVPPGAIVEFSSRTPPGWTPSLCIQGQDMGRALAGTRVGVLRPLGRR